MRIYEFTNAEEQVDLLTQIVNLTRSQIMSEHLFKDMGTSDSGGESTLDFVKRLIDNTFSEIDDWAMKRSVGFVDHDNLDQKSTQSVQPKKTVTKKTVSKPVKIKPLKLKKKPLPQAPVTDKEKVQPMPVQKSLENLPTIKSIQPTAMKTFSGLNQV